MATMAEILKNYGQSYIQKYKEDILPSHKHTILDIINCRTEVMGGHVYKCREHDQVEFRFHSCYNRHCQGVRMNRQLSGWKMNKND